MKSATTSPYTRDIALLGLMFAAVYPLAAGSLQTVVFFFLLWAQLGVAWSIAAAGARILSLGHSAFIGTGAYAAVILFDQLSVSPWLGALAGGLVAVILAAVFGMVLLPLRGLYYVLGTVALAVSLGDFVSGTQQLGPIALNGGDGVNILPIQASFWNMQFRTNRPLIIIAWLLLGVTIVVARRVGRGRVGLHLHAMGDNEQLAKALGVAVTQKKVVIFCVSAFLSALGGTIWAQYALSVSPGGVFSLNTALLPVMVAAMGGIGASVWAPVVGSAILVIPADYLQITLGSRLPSGAASAIYGVILVVVVLGFPKGVVGTMLEHRRFWSVLIGRMRRFLGTAEHQHGGEIAALRARGSYEVISEGEGDGET